MNESHPEFISPFKDVSSTLRQTVHYVTYTYRPSSLEPNLTL